MHASRDSYDGIPDTHASKRRADVVISGQWVATVYESGGFNASDKYRSALQALNNDGLTADQIAVRIANSVGGTVMTPRDWD